MPSFIFNPGNNGLSFYNETHAMHHTYGSRFVYRFFPHLWLIPGFFLFLLFFSFFYPNWKTLAFDKMFDKHKLILFYFLLNYLLMKKTWQRARSGKHEITFLQGRLLEQVTHYHRFLWSFSGMALYEHKIQMNLNSAPGLPGEGGTWLLASLPGSMSTFLTHWVRNLLIITYHGCWWWSKYEASDSK